VTLQASSGAFGGGRKLWPAEHWAQLVRLLRRRGASVLQLGATDEKRIAGAVPLLGEQDIRRSIAIVGEADIHVGTVSSLMHGSAAVGTPAVIIYGGFERSSAHGYPSVHPIESSISCAPCARAGVRMPACPLGNECMRAITPQHVFHEVMSVLHRGTAASPAGQR
jgi:ADP-heptose:LPS heptosyltransferase